MHIALAALAIGILAIGGLHLFLWVSGTAAITWAYAFGKGRKYEDELLRQGWESLRVEREAFEEEQEAFETAQRRRREEELNEQFRRYRAEAAGGASAAGSGSGAGAKKGKRKTKPKADPPPQEKRKSTWGRHWDVLGIEPTNDEAAVTAAFRERLKVVHPSRGGSDQATRELIEAREAVKREMGWVKQPA